MRILKSLIIILMLLGLIAVDGMTQESAPTMINYQGFLTDQNGTPLNGSYQITFALYSESTGAQSIVWEETHDVVYVENGLFNVLLGGVDTLSAGDLDGERYLGIRMVGEPEMTPRMRLASVAYSLHAEEANNANTIENFRIVSGYVSSDGTGTGSGFTSVRTATGQYTITFETAFSSAPNVIVSGKSSVDNWFYVASSSNSSVSIYSEDEDSAPDAGGSYQNANFYFIAIGNR